VPPQDAWQAQAAGWFTALIPKYRRLVPYQLDSLEALDQLGERLTVYAGIEVPTVLIGGDRSSAHLSQRLDAIERAIPHADREVMHHRDHAADAKYPRQIARLIETLADKVLQR
jgi:hypothetical protein